MQHLRPNTTLQGGKYRIERVLGQGGFGITYLAHNTVFDIDVAIKEFFMKDENDRDGSSVTMPNTTKQELFLGQMEKFKKEAKRMFAIKNEHIIGVQDLFEENGTAYYVMDYVDGENLAERLKRTGKPMSEQEVRDILPQILDALKAVHDADIWHLDLKPANILIDKSGIVKLIDFGASKQLNAQKGGATTSTAISYTNGYAPREQMEQNYDKFGPWTDIYALGATLYNLLTNKRPPLPSDIDDDMSEDKHLALPFPENVGGLKFLVLQMMKTNRLQRPQSVEAIICSEKARKEEPKTKTPPKNSPKRAPSSNDEETFIAEPQPKQVKKGAATNPKPPKPAVEEKSETSDSMPDEETIIVSKEGKPSVQSQEKTKLNVGTLTNTVDYLKHPFNASVISIISIIIVICISTFFIPRLFSFEYDTFILLLISDFLFCIASIVLVIPFIIGIREVSKSISILLIISQCIIVARYIYNLYLYFISTDDVVFDSQRAIFYDEFLAYVLVGGYYFLNWGLLYCYLILYLVCGVLMVKNYNGKLKTFGGLFTSYALLTIIMNAFSTVSSIIDWCLFYELLIWGIYMLWVYGMWWMLTRKPILENK